MLETYLRDIDQTPLLTAEQERELATRIKDGDRQARDQMIRANLRFVVHVARRYVRRGLPLDDVIQLGNLGLLIAISKFDLSFHCRFCTYACYWIRQQILIGIKNTASTIRVPSYVHEMIRKLQHGKLDLAKERSGRRKLRTMRQAMQISWEPNQEQGLKVATDQQHRQPAVAAEISDEINHAMKLLSELNDNERSVVELHLGLNGHEPTTLAEIGRQLGVTRERARQIERRALDKIKAQCEA